MDDKVETLEQKNSEIAEGHQEKTEQTIVEKAIEERKKLEATLAKIQEERNKMDRIQAEIALGGKSLGGQTKIKSPEELDREEGQSIVKRYFNK